MACAAMEILESRRFLTASGLPVRFGGPTFDTGVSVAAAPDGGAVEGGLFSGTATFGTGSAAVQLTSVGETDVFVAKYSVHGVLQWVRQFGGPGGLFKADSTPDLAIDPERSGSAVEGPSVKPPQLGETIGGVAVDSSGNVFFTGSFYGTVTFTAGKSVRTFVAAGKFGGQYPDIYLIKLTGSGSLSWSDQIGGSFSDAAKGITLDSSGNPYLTGYFSRTANFDPGKGTFDLTSHGRSDAFAAKYSGTDGRLIWADQFGSNDLGSQRRNTGNSIAVDSSGDAYVTGTFAGTAFFGTGASGFSLRSYGQADEFIEKLDNKGDLIWAKQIGGEGDDGGTNIALGPGGSIYTVSYFENTVNVIPNTNQPTDPVKNFQATPDNPGQTPNRSDLLVEKLTNNGSLIWARQIAGAGWEVAGGLAVDPGGNAYITGSFYGPTDFNFRGTPQVITSRLGVGTFNDNNDNNRSRSYDIFVEKLSTNGRYIYTRTLGGAGDDFGLGDAITSSGNLLVTGRFRGTVDFDPSASGVHHLLDAGLSDGFLLDLTGTGGPG